MIGKKIQVNLTSRGTTYVDGGYEISNATEEGCNILDAGISYICPHRTACGSLSSREDDCPQCKNAI